jgi:hypothetical protein
MFRGSPYLALCWNWKAAVTSAIARGILFYAVNRTHGIEAARAAFITEFALRGATSGFYGAVTASFRRIEPAWKGTLIALLLLPLISHAVELVAHWVRGTEALAASIGASVVFTMVSTAFNLHVMRHGVLTVGDGSQSLLSDIRALPRLTVTFIGLRSPTRA